MAKIEVTHTDGDGGILVNLPEDAVSYNMEGLLYFAFSLADAKAMRDMLNEAIETEMLTEAYLNGRREEAAAANA